MTTSTAHPVTLLRLQKNLTVEQLAALASLSPVAIARIEAGLSRRPHRSTLLELAKHLGADADDLEVQITRYAQVQS
jgi:transcriptional regulator with XRE-family HTH domain